MNNCYRLSVQYRCREFADFQVSVCLVGMVVLVSDVCSEFGAIQGKVTSSDGHLRGSEAKPRQLLRHPHGNHALRDAGTCQEAACCVEVLAMSTCDASRAMSLHMMQVFKTGGTSGTASSRASLSFTLMLSKHRTGGGVIFRSTNSSEPHPGRHPQQSGPARHSLTRHQPGSLRERS